MGERRGTKALELWCRRMTEGYPGVDVTNMTTSWRDGLAFCAIIHHFRPDLLDFDKLNKADVYYNNDLAFRTAERHLGIPALLDASDMALYEVPDRLSILTYLSQFYQVFGSQDSSHRLKRTSATTEKSPISKPPGPPAKMAHVVGVPKRDPCSACGLPVFLAERLTIPGVSGSGSKRVYHRTCLRCARCKSQLTPGSFYETEVDGEYCCETCPDEEKLESMEAPSVEGSSDKTPSLPGTSRGSIAERLAFFENDGKKLLQKSLSDEEKSQSLQQISETQKSVYKQNPALSKFMSSHLSDITDSGALSPDRTQSNQSSRRSSISTTASLTSGVDDEEDSSEKAPALPKSLPPSLIPSAEKPSPDKPPTTTPTTFKSSLELSFDNTSNSSLSTSLSPSPLKTSTKQIASDKTYKTENEDLPKLTKPQEEENEVSKTPTKSIAVGEISATVRVTNVDSTDQINVTKDISDNDEKMRTTTAETSTTSSTAMTTSSKASPTKFDDISQTNRSSMVRARLHQFEIISSKSNSPSSSISNNVSNRSDKDSSTNENKASTSEPMSIALDAPKTDEDTQATATIITSKKTLETEVPRIASKETTIETTENDAKEDDSFKDNSSTNLELNETETGPSDASYSKQEDSIEEILEDKPKEEEKPDHLPEKAPRSKSSPARKSSNANVTDEYPEDLNPFKSDEEDEDEDVEKEEKTKSTADQDKMSKDEKRKSLNPFDSSDDEIEYKDETPKKVKPPRPPPPKLKSTNPFDSEDDGGDEDDAKSVESAKKRPVPTPRSHLTSSQNTTPEPTPRLSRQAYATPLSQTSDQYGSSSSLTNQSLGLHSSSEFLRRGSDTRGSSHSIGSSTGSLSGGKYKKGKKAPLPPKPENATAKELFPAPSPDPQKLSPQPRKKRPAPAPPPVIETTPATPEVDKFADSPDHLSDAPCKIPQTDDVKSGEEKLIGEDKLSDEEKLKEIVTTPSEIPPADNDSKTTRRLITVDASLLEDSFARGSDSRPKEEETVVYRRTIAPLVIENSVDEEDDIPESHDRQLEKLKDNKEAKNRNRKSQISLPLPTEENDPLYNKSVHGKWKRRKGPAPALPVPPKKVLQMLPLQEIRHELEIIEVQQQGLEKQGVMLEKMIRERCEGGEGANDVKEDEPPKSSVTNSKEVEDLIMQLFELVNEKNELFRRQAELMYLRRQHRLEQEQADLEYEIRVLMAQPERNKTDSDKAREEALIARLVEVVQLRNEVIECLEMDRLREAEEDMSIKQRLEMHAAKRDEELCKQTPTKLSKKEKKRQKEAKKLGKSKKLDADKDADESELPATEKKEKKKKKNILTSVIPFK
ncbi:MICAL-like protein 1 isoform X2 [Hermetia illucens]|nr:MICAL-like protein 1 isoform X2 [Hermetia illucens]XP_037918778.1 MICAL-like protein 1 isoform X2 [Hermetia illucens]